MIAMEIQTIVELNLQKEISLKCPHYISNKAKSVNPYVVRLEKKILPICEKSLFLDKWN